jgi:hypothetical protein
MAQRDLYRYALHERVAHGLAPDSQYFVEHGTFFSTFKTERLSKQHFWARDDLQADVFDYTKRFYNLSGVISISATLARRIE